MPLQATSGAASYDAFGGGVAAVPTYIEDVFNSYLWTTSGSDQTLTTGIDMTKGALTWIKGRSNAFSHILQTGIGGGVLPNNALSTNSTAAYAGGNYRIAESTTGFTMGTDYYTGTPQTAVVWTFRKQPKFFDVVTYTGNGTSGRAIPHSLGSTPGCIIVKCTTNTYDWMVYHRSLPSSSYFLKLNTTAAQVNVSSIWSTTAPTATNFYVGSDGSTNGSGETYVAYLFAHNAGGFGLTGTDNVISCGSYTGTGTTVGPTVNLGYEPQWLMVKASSSDPGYPSNRWTIIDNMRGWPSGPNANSQWLIANTSDSEQSGGGQVANMTSTGFTVGSERNDSGVTFIYIAIRRGPMKVPTSGTSVFSVESYNQTSASDPAFNLGKVADAGLRRVSDFEDSWRFQSRLTGNGGLITSSTDAESTMNYGKWDNNVGWYQGASITPPYSQANWYGWTFARAPSFFDEVCYTGTEVSGQTFNHNLGAVPEMMIVKARSGTTDWTVYHSALGASARIYLNATNAANTGTAAPWNSTAPTSTVFSLGDAGATNLSGTTFVNYLFATCAGVSKVGSYTGNGSTQTIDCGFGAGGARFVLIKRTDATGNWYVYDTARGMTVLTDPYLLINTTGAEVATLGSVTTVSTGFALNSAILAAINVSSGSYIFLAIA